MVTPQSHCQVISSLTISCGFDCLGKRWRRLGHANRRRSQYGEVEEWQREFIALEHELGSGVWIESMLWSNAVELREASCYGSDGFNCHRMSGVLQHDYEAVHTMPKRSFAVPSVPGAVGSMPHLQGSLQRREMFISRAGDKNSSAMHAPNQDTFTFLRRFMRRCSRRSTWKTARKARFVREFSAPKPAARARNRGKPLRPHRNQIHTRKSSWQKSWAGRPRRWRAWANAKICRESPKKVEWLRRKWCRNRRAIFHGRLDIHGVLCLVNYVRKCG